MENVAERREPTADIALPGYLEKRRSRLLADLATTVASPHIVEAFANVPRHVFVPEALEESSYDDQALPLAHEQTISQPSMIAFMLKQLDPKPYHKALEVGAGCGYAAALLAQLVREVHAVEIRAPLVALAHSCLARAGVSNVVIHEGDGSRGLLQEGPFDCILVSCGATTVPDALVRDLAPGGRIAIPVGDGKEQVLVLGSKSADGTRVDWLRSMPCVFVPLVNPSHE
jgi:protein-L-isoaspartate(D-aspartate) O-methyltransferase